MEKRKRPRIPAKPEYSRPTPPPVKKLKAKKYYTINQYFKKFNLTNEEESKLGQAAMVLMKHYNYDVKKVSQFINNRDIMVVLYPKRVLSIIFKLRGYITGEDLRYDSRGVNKR